MRVLLDTNALIWQIGLEKTKLGPETVMLLQQSDKVFVSAISIVEIQIKTMLGRLNAPDNCEQMVLDAGDDVLGFSARSADSVREFPTLVRHDPFDRMLLAQALSEDLLFVTADTTLLGLGLSYIVDARL